jgi:DNA-binding HxlR family transcriptional regulator
MAGAGLSELSDDLILRRAYELVAEAGDLRRSILFDLIGRPRRYNELKPLLRGRRDHNLTVALTRLQRDGLIDRRTDARQRPLVHSYELTPLGVQVILGMQSIRPVHEAFESYRRGRGLPARA